MGNGENRISKHLNFKIFWGGHAPRDPPRKLAPLALKNPVGTSTSKLIDSTA